MGINYYAEIDVCRRDKAKERVHIGKKSYGWEFSFAAAEGVKSYEDWKKFILGKKNIKIIDEDGDEVSIEDFFEIVESSRNEYRLGSPPHNDDQSLMKPKNHHDYVMSEPAYSYLRYDPRYWKDSEGWSFYEGDFS